MFNKNMNKIFIALVLKHLTVSCNRRLDIHNKGDCFDVTGNQCPIHSVNDVGHISEQDNSLQCMKKAAYCNIVSKMHCTQNDSCKSRFNHYLPHIISMTLNCIENELVSVIGGQLFGYSGSQIDIRHKGMYSQCEQKSCNYSFCCMNNHLEQTQTSMHNLSSDDLLLLKWNQDCEQKQKCTIKVPRWDMLTDPHKNNLTLDYKNDCQASYPYYPQRKCVACRVNVQYHCLPEDYQQLVSDKENTVKILYIVIGCVSFALFAIGVICKVYRGKTNNPIQNTINTAPENIYYDIAHNQHRINSKKEIDIMEQPYYNIIDDEQVVKSSEESDMEMKSITQCNSDQHQHNSAFEDKYESIYI